MGSKNGGGHGAIAVFLAIALLASFFAAVPAASAQPPVTENQDPWTDANGVTWSDTIRITTDPNADCRPSIIEFATYGILEKYIFWDSRRPLLGPDQLYPDLWYKTSADPDGASWSHAILLTAEGRNQHPASARVTRGSSRELWVAWSSERPSSAMYDIYYKYLYQSSPHAWEWSDDIRLEPSGWNHFLHDIDPSIVQTSNGDIYIAWSSDIDGDFEIYLTKSSDGGASWDTPIKLTTNTYEDSWTSMIQKTNGEIWIAFCSDMDADYEIYYIIYDPLSTVWSPPIQLTFNSVFDWRPSMMLKQNGDIWIAWDSFILVGAYEVFYIFTSDNGITWSTAVNVTNNPAIDEAPGITQTIDGRVWVTWHRYSEGDYEIYAMYGEQPAKFIAHFMTPEGEPYPFDVIISDGTWRKEWKDVTCIETEVPRDATYTCVYHWEDYSVMNQFVLNLTAAKFYDFCGYAINPAEIEPRVRPYIFAQEVGANASLSWEWDAVNNRLDWSLSGEPGKLIGLEFYIDDALKVIPNYAVDTLAGKRPLNRIPSVSKSPGDFGTKWTFIYELESLGVVIPGDVNSAEIDPDNAILGLRAALCNDAMISGDRIVDIRDIAGVAYEADFLYPQYALPPGNYTLGCRIPPEMDDEIDLPFDLSPDKPQIIDIYLIATADLEPFTFSSAAENFFANSSFSNLTHDEETNTLSVNVTTETACDWWGCFVLPDTATVAAARSYDGVIWHDLDELYDYTINPVDGYKIVVVRITPETEQLILKYKADPWSYDQDNSGYIEIGELLQAINDYIGGSITISQLLEIINLYISHTHK